MHPSISPSLLLTVLLACIGGASCSSDPPVATPTDGGLVDAADAVADAPAACTTYVPPTGFDPMQPTVSLKKNVMGLFSNSCTFTSCHGSPSSSKGGLFLGAQTQMGADSSMVRTLIVGVAAGSLPSMPYVTAGDPTKSFIMHKMDGDQCTLESMCTKPAGCQGSMPQGSDLLPPASRDIVRRWIAQGALDN